MTVLNNSVPNWLRFFVLIFYITLVPLLFLLIFCFFIPMITFCDKCAKSTYSGCLRPVTQYMFCYRNRNHKYPGLFVAIFGWIIYITICIVFSLLMTAIFIIPMYLFSIVSLCRMAYWWRKNKRLNVKQMTQEQKDF